MYAHKVVLCARSEYFKRLFLSGMREATETVSEMQDVSYDVFAGLLEFIYTDALPNISPAIAVDLLALSHEYILGRLKVGYWYVAMVIMYRVCVKSVFCIKGKLILKIAWRLVFVFKYKELKKRCIITLLCMKQTL